MDDPESTTNPWLKWWGDPWVDTQNQRLTLSLDDLVRRKEPIAGSYYVRHTVTLQGITAYAIAPHGPVGPMPTLRRSGAGIELGGTGYGGNEWSTTEPAGFAGHVIPDTLTAVVTVYVKRQVPEFAVEVEAGEATYRSGWQAWDDSDPDYGELYLLGQNNSAGTGSAAERVYVGPLTVCSELSDESLAAIYDD